MGLVSDNHTHEFNLTKFCYLAGTTVGVSETYRIILLISFIIIGTLVIMTNSFALYIVVRKKAQYFQKGKVFMLTLIIHDLLSGFTVIPLFVVELCVHRDEVNCTVSSLRVLFFGYFLSCRILGIFFISLQTYIKMDKQNTILEYRFEHFSAPISVLFIWTPGILFIIGVGFSHVKTDKILGTVVFIPVVIVLMASVACYVMVLRVIKNAESRQQSAIYKEGTSYLKKVLTWFLLTNIPLCVCGLVLVIYAFYPEAKERDKLIVQQIYVVALAITSLDAMINPYLFLQKHDELDGYVNYCLSKCCCHSNCCHGYCCQEESEESKRGSMITKDRTYYTFELSNGTNLGYQNHEETASSET